METNNSTKANETLFEGQNAMNKTVNDAATALLDTYKKQLTLASEFYSNIFNSSFDQSKNNWSPNSNYVDMFFNNNNALKFMTGPFNFAGANGSGVNPLSSVFEKIVKQITDYNQNMIGALKKQFDGWNVNWTGLNEKYHQTVQKRFEGSKELMNTLTDTYSKQAQFSLETNKKLIEEISKQIDLVFKVNQQFWSDLVTTTQSNAPADKFSMDGQSNGIKKPTKANVGL